MLTSLVLISLVLIWRDAAMYRTEMGAVAITWIGRIAIEADGVDSTVSAIASRMVRVD